MVPKTTLGLKRPQISHRIRNRQARPGANETSPTHDYPRFYYHLDLLIRFINQAMLRILAFYFANHRLQDPPFALGTIYNFDFNFGAVYSYGKYNPFLRSGRLIERGETHNSGEERLRDCQNNLGPQQRASIDGLPLLSSTDMSSWMNDAAVQNHNGAGFNHLNESNTGGNMMDPSGFMPTSSSFDPNQFQNQQLQQRMQNVQVHHRGKLLACYRTLARKLRNRMLIPDSHLTMSLHNMRLNRLHTRICKMDQAMPARLPSWLISYVPAASRSESRQLPLTHSHHHNPIMAAELIHHKVAHLPQNTPYAPGYSQNFTPPPGRTSAPPQKRNGNTTDATYDGTTSNVQSTGATTEPPVATKKPFTGPN
ncbi:hypothetical protein EYC84_009122 [Monilinia fructicola]|uniref:Uncharacterized protein n=1 Tax=Monilinia fructicola TaxID=38448 RepID=A0A5M9JHI4_MONFR|nr:hypothetical protein EYC84_009122 [Monilinia fructicola]